jgi:hypothetical protein
VGIFEPASGNDPHVVINQLVGGDAAFRTGVAVANSFRSGIAFSGTSLARLGQGETVSLGSLTYYNGITQVGSSSHHATLNLYLRPFSPAADWVYLATVDFGLDATLNRSGRDTADYFLARYTTPGRALIGDDWVPLTLSGLPSLVSVAENSKLNLGNLTVTAGSPIPIPDKGSCLMLVALGLAFTMAQSDVLRRTTVGNVC